MWATLVVALRSARVMGAFKGRLWSPVDTGGVANGAPIRRIGAQRSALHRVAARMIGSMALRLAQQLRPSALLAQGRSAALLP